MEVISDAVEIDGGKQRVEIDRGKQRVETDGGYQRLCGDKWRLSTMLWRMMEVISDAVEINGGYQRCWGDGWGLSTCGVIYID